MAVKTVIQMVIFMTMMSLYWCNKSNYSEVFYARSAWGAQPATGTRPLDLPVPLVVIHHTYIPGACYTKDACSTYMRSMQRYHMSMDWGDIGYNFCVGSDGGVYEGRGWQTVGIHAGPANNHSIGICLIGDWRETLPPAPQLLATKNLIRRGVREGFISTDYKLIGHNQAMSTECPGRALINHISKWDHFDPEFTIAKNKSQILT